MEFICIYRRKNAFILISIDQFLMVLLVATIEESKPRSLMVTRGLSYTKFLGTLLKPVFKISQDLSLGISCKFAWIALEQIREENKPIFWPLAYSLEDAVLSPMLPTGVSFPLAQIQAVDNPFDWPCLFDSIFSFIMQLQPKQRIPPWSKQLLPLSPYRRTNECI